MRFATLRDGTRDGALVVVNSTGSSWASAGTIAKHLQWALDNWQECAPKLQALADDLERGSLPGQPLIASECLAPLPRAYEWVDGSAYLNHIVLVRRARGAGPPDGMDTDPLVYQGGSGTFLGPTADLGLLDEGFGLDLEAELCAVLGDVPQGRLPEAPAQLIRLFLLANDVTLRNLVPAELAKGFGFFCSKPSTAFAPLAVTPDELGAAFVAGRVHLTVHVRLNGQLIGCAESGPEMHFSFFDLMSHITRTRGFTAGTILGSGTISNRDPSRGVSCLAEARALQTIRDGQPSTPYLNVGDAVRIEAFDAAGRSVFGAIDQRVTPRG